MFLHSYSLPESWRRHDINTSKVATLTYWTISNPASRVREERT